VADRWNAAHDDDDALFQDAKNHLEYGVVLDVYAILGTVGGSVDPVGFEDRHQHGEYGEAHYEDNAKSLSERHLEAPDEIHGEGNVG
jgi:hypothetical protein